MKPMTLPAAGLAALLSLPAAAQTPPPLTEQGPDLWRTSRLVGVDVLGPEGKAVGTVVDVLLDHDGRAAAVVVGVGGVLGIGRKDVALPYGAVHFTDAARPAGAGPGATENAAGMPTEPGMAENSAIPVETPAAQAAPPGSGAPAPAALGGPVGTTTGVPGGQATGLAAAPAAAPGGTASPRGATRRPDHATVDLTADQLKAAPAFAFAP